MRLDYFLTGRVNNQLVELIGHGNASGGSGNVDMHITERFAPPDWDPSIITLMCRDSVRLFTANVIHASASYNTFINGLSAIRFGGPRLVDHTREGIIMDANGRTIVNLKAKSDLFINDSTVYSRTIVTTAVSLLHNYGGIASVEFSYQETVFSLMPGIAIGISKYTLKLGNGEIAQEFTKYPYEFEGSSAFEDNIVLSVNSATVLQTNVANEYRYLMSIDGREFKFQL